LGTDSR